MVWTHLVFQQGFNGLRFSNSSAVVRNLCLHTTHISDLVLKQSYNAHVPNSWRDRAHTDAKQLMCIQEWLRNYPSAFFLQLTQKYRVLYFWIVGLEVWKIFNFNLL